MKSIIQREKECYWCRELYDYSNQICLHDHHVFPGSRRSDSERLGLKVWLCENHHTGAEGVHQNYEKMRLLQRIAQAKYEDDHGHEAWMREMGRNYL